jgi:hypothetical protein
VQLPWPYLSRASKSICVLFSLSCNLFMIATFVCDREGSSQSSWTCTILSSLPLFSNHSLLFPLLYFFFHHPFSPLHELCIAWPRELLFLIQARFI